MYRDGKNYFLNPWSLECQLPQFRDMDWGPASSPTAQLTTEEIDAVQDRFAIYHAKKKKENDDAFAAAMARQKQIAEQGEIDRLARLSARAQAFISPPPPPPTIEQPVAAITTATQPTPEPVAARTETRKEVRSAPVQRGPIRVVINNANIDWTRVTARVRR